MAAAALIARNRRRARRLRLLKARPGGVRHSFR
jgi:hypothetical protein